MNACPLSVTIFLEKASGECSLLAIIKQNVFYTQTEIQENHLYARREEEGFWHNTEATGKQDAPSTSNHIQDRDVREKD